jgi:pimeloyl-ACP methyl ester carboxylesterase
MDLVCDDIGSGSPIVCMPGFGLDRSVMAAALEPVLGQRPGLRRIYLDLPGHGESAAGMPTSAAVVDAVSAFIDTRLGDTPPLLAGWSYGGYIAMAIARRRPAGVAGLLLICPGVRIRPEDRDVPGPPAAPSPGGWLDGVPGELRSPLAKALGNRTAQVATRVAAILSASRPGDEDYLRELRDRGYRLPDEDSRAEFTGPVSIITGRQDRVCGYADQFRLLADYPRAAFAIVANAGHYLPIEQPADFRALVAGWLRSCALPADPPADLPGLTGPADRAG